MTDEELYYLLESDNKALALEGFNELYSRYSSKIYVYCLKVLSNEDLAQDIFQETFTRFYESANTKRVMTNVGGYLIRIARNLCINEKIKKYNNKVPLEDIHLPYYDNTYDKKQTSELLHTAIDTLPHKFREVIVLKEFMDLSYKEIAEVLEVSLSVVRIRIYRAKNKLREILTPYIEEMKNIK